MAGARRGRLEHGPEPAPLDAQNGDELVQAAPLAQEQPMVRPWRGKQDNGEWLLSFCPVPAYFLMAALVRRGHVADPLSICIWRPPHLRVTRLLQLHLRPELVGCCVVPMIRVTGSRHRIAINREHAQIAALDKALEAVFVKLCYVTYEDG